MYVDRFSFLSFRSVHLSEVYTAYDESSYYMQDMTQHDDVVIFTSFSSVSALMVEPEPVPGTPGLRREYTAQFPTTLI